MIFSRFGTPVEIVGYCGKFQPPEMAAAMVLVKVRFDDKRIRHAFAGFLRADDGMKEINSAVDAAPQTTLTPSELASAIAEAL